MKNPFAKTASASAAESAVGATRKAVDEMWRSERANERKLIDETKRADAAYAAAAKDAGALVVEAATVRARATTAAAAIEADRQARAQAASEQLEREQLELDAATAAGDVAAIERTAQAVATTRAAGPDRAEIAAQARSDALQRVAERQEQAAAAAEAKRQEAQRASARAGFELARHRMDLKQADALLAYVAAKAAWRRWAAVDERAPALAPPILHLRQVRPMPELWADVPDAAMPLEVERRLLELFADPTVELPSAT